MDGGKTSPISYELPLVRDPSTGLTLPGGAHQTFTKDSRGYERKNFKITPPWPKIRVGPHLSLCVLLFP